MTVFDTLELNIDNDPVQIIPDQKLPQIFEIHKPLKSLIVSLIYNLVDGNYGNISDEEAESNDAFRWGEGGTTGLIGRYPTMIGEICLRYIDHKIFISLEGDE